MTRRRPSPVAWAAANSGAKMARTAPIGVVLAAILLRSAPASGDSVRSQGGLACKRDYRSAQELEQSGHLLEARQLLLQCAKSTCGRFLLRECTTRYTQLESDIPTVVPRVTDEAGAPRGDVQVTVDGGPLTVQLDGHAVEVDPGLHEFSFAKYGVAFVTEKLVIVQGQRDRLISVSLRSPPKSVLATARAEAPAAAPAIEARTAPAPSETGPSDRDAPAPDASSHGTARSRDDVDAPDGPWKPGPSALPYVLGGAGVMGVGA